MRCCRHVKSVRTLLVASLTLLLIVIGIHEGVDRSNDILRQLLQQGKWLEPHLLTTNATHISIPSRITASVTEKSRSTYPDGNVESQSSTLSNHNATYYSTSGEPHTARSLNVSTRLCSNQERLDLIKHSCPSIGVTLKTTDLKQIWVDEKHKVLACINFKAASSTWIMTLANNTVDFNFSLKESSQKAEKIAKLRRLNSYSLKDRERMIGTYYKLMIVRHPLERLASAYSSKLNPGNKYYQKAWGVPIARKYRQIKGAQPYYGDIQFAELLRYIVDGARDEHWKPMIQACNPCAIKYDYIAKVETQKRDSEYIIKNKLSNKSLNLHVYRTRTNNSVLDPGGRYLEQADYVQDNLLAKVYNKYKDDFEYFGYGYEKRDDKWFTYCHGKCC